MGELVHQDALIDHSAFTQHSNGYMPTGEAAQEINFPLHDDAEPLPGR
jgi:hypothetical protein